MKKFIVTLIFDSLRFESEENADSSVEAMLKAMKHMPRTNSAMSLSCRVAS